MGTSGSRFLDRVVSTPITESSRRAVLAELIRSSREELRNLFDLGPAGDPGDWSAVRKVIAEKLPGLQDAGRAARVRELLDNLLDAEEELIEGNLRLVLMVVRRYSRGDMGALEEMDFVQEGCEGLLDAVRRFDFRSGRGFLTYAVIRIRRRVLLAMEKQQRLVRLPSHAVKKTIYLRQVIDDFTSREGRYPLPHEIEEETGNSIDWWLILSLSEKVLPLHSPAGEDGLPLSERLAGNAPSPEDTGNAEALEKAMEKLDSRSRFVLAMRYGLVDGDPRTLANIAGMLDLSIERTRQIEKKALEVLRDHFSGFSAADWLHC